ncbi:MAG: hypothetical protein ACK4HC_09400 [Cloacibacterium sp.]
MPTLHSHTHWQAPQADTQAKACQRVCLSHAEKKKLKIPFPSKNFKNANPQTDTKTFGQLVAKLNKDKGFSHGQQERQPVTAVTVAQLFFLENSFQKHKILTSFIFRLIQKPDLKSVFS